MIKLNRKSKNPLFEGTISLNYDDTEGNHHQQKYPFKYEFHPEEQFFSDETLRTALEAYTFVSEIKTLLEASKK